MEGTASSRKGTRARWFWHVRWWRGSLIAILLALPTTALAQPLTIDVSPTGGELRAGPLGLNPSSAVSADEQIPIAIQIDEAAVDAKSSGTK